MIGKILKRITLQLFLMLFMLKRKIYPAYVSKFDSNREEQVILLMISNGQKHVAVKSEGR